MFDTFLMSWNSSFLKGKVQENNIKELELKEPDAWREAVLSNRVVKEPTNCTFNYSHGLPPRPNSNRSISCGLRRKRGCSLSKSDIENNLAQVYSARDAVVPSSLVSAVDGNESSGDVGSLSSNFHDFNILAKEDSEDNLAHRAPTLLKDQQFESKQPHCSLPCAKDMGPGWIPQAWRMQICQSVRSTVARVIRRVTGLSLATVEKWFSLLSHFLELSAEEQLMLIILLQKYLRHGGALRGSQDNLRPQKWERVLGLCAYFSVWLSEEFAARTREDLVTLMGPRFVFGKEQIEFLITVDWNVYIGYDEYFQTLEMFMVPDEMQRDIRIWEWLGYSSSELTESLDVCKEVILNNLTGLSSLLGTGRKRQPVFLSDGKDAVGERRFFRKLASDTLPCTQENLMDSIPLCT